jgi:hypothetical protein
MRKIIYVKGDYGRLALVRGPIRLSGLEKHCLLMSYVFI